MTTYSSSHTSYTTPRKSKTQGPSGLRVRTGSLKSSAQRGSLPADHFSPPSFFTGHRMRRRRSRGVVVYTVLSPKSYEFVLRNDFLLVQESSAVVLLYRHTTTDHGTQGPTGTPIALRAFAYIVLRLEIIKEFRIRNYKGSHPIPISFFLFYLSLSLSG
jgi:hypothetical protein